MVPNRTQAPLGLTRFNVLRLSVCVCATTYPGLVARAFGLLIEKMSYPCARAISIIVKRLHKLNKSRSIFLKKNLEKFHMPKENKLTNLIRQQIDVENEHIKNLVDLRKEVGNAATRLLLLEMRLDSEKHVSMLNEMLEILEGIPTNTSLWDLELEEYIDGVSRTRSEKEFREYVTKENSVLENLKEELKHSEDEGIKILFQNIDEDEKKQNRIVKTIVENLYRSARKTSS